MVVDLLSKTEVGEMLTEKGIDNMVENCIMHEENDYEILVSLSNSDDPVSLGDSISHVAEAIMEVDVTDSIESE